MLCELRRLVVPGGRALVITELARPGLGGRFLPGRRPSRSPDALRRLLGTPVETFSSGLRLYAGALLWWS